MITVAKWLNYDKGTPHTTHAEVPTHTNNQSVIQ